MFPTFNPLPADHFSRSNRTLLTLTLILILAGFAIDWLGAGTARAALAQPTVTGSLIEGTDALIKIQGDGFTPGRRVQLVVTDITGATLHEPVWTVAARGAPFGDDGIYSGVTGYGVAGAVYVVLDLSDTAIYGPNGSQDPANGYDPGTDLALLKLTSSIQVRALDEQTSTWSSFAVVDTGSTLGYHPGSSHPYAPPWSCVALIPCTLEY